MTDATDFLHNAEYYTTPTQKNVRRLTFLLHVTLMTLNFFINNKGKDQRSDWFIYFTHWMMAANLIESLVVMPSGINTLPKYKLFHLTHTMTLIVTVVFWTVLLPIYVKQAGQQHNATHNITPNSTAPVEASGAVLVLEQTIPHLLPCIVNGINAKLTQPTYRFEWRFCILTMMMLSAYTVFSWLYEREGGTDPDGHSYIYPPLDWENDAGVAALICSVGILIGVPAINFTFSSATIDRFLPCCSSDMKSRLDVTETYKEQSKEFKRPYLALLSCFNSVFSCCRSARDDEVKGALLPGGTGPNYGTIQTSF
jgi:hypothetical protein